MYRNTNVSNWKIKWEKRFYFERLSQLANIGPQDAPKTSPKDPIWPSRGRPTVTSWGRPNLTFKGHPWEVDLGLPRDVLRTSPRRPSEHSNLDVPIFVNFYFRTYSIDQIYLKSFQHSRCIENPVKLLRWSIFRKTFSPLTIFVKELHRKSSNGFLIRLWYCLVMLFDMLIGW